MHPWQCQPRGGGRKSNRPHSTATRAGRTLWASMGYRDQTRRATKQKDSRNWVQGEGSGSVTSLEASCPPVSFQVLPWVKRGNRPRSRQHTARRSCMTVKVTVKASGKLQAFAYLGRWSVNLNSYPRLTQRLPSRPAPSRRLQQAT